MMKITESLLAKLGKAIKDDLFRGGRTAKVIQEMVEVGHPLDYLKLKPTLGVNIDENAQARIESIEVEPVEAEQTIALPILVNRRKGKNRGWRARRDSPA